MILEQLAEHSRQRVQEAKRQLPLAELKARAEAQPRGNFRFEKALKKDGLTFICEVKKASPSKGVIDADFPYREIARQYEQAGADCVSVLTEPKWFLGSDAIFNEIRQTISLPMIRKDFTVDEYQLYQAKVMGADAVLLICALLDTEAIQRYLTICDALGLTALVEAHDEKEIDSALAAGARVIGINNRNLNDFTVDFGNASRLRAHISPDVVFVAESGIQTRADIASLEQLGTDAVLVGETLMKSPDKKEMLLHLRGEQDD